MAEEGLVLPTSNLSLLSCGSMKDERRGAERGGESKPLQSSTERSNGYTKQALKKQEAASPKEGNAERCLKGELGLRLR